MSVKVSIVCFVGTTAGRVAKQPEIHSLLQARREILNIAGPPVTCRPSPMQVHWAEEGCIDYATGRSLPGVIEDCTYKNLFEYEGEHEQVFDFSEVNISWTPLSCDSDGPWVVHGVQRLFEAPCVAYVNTIKDGSKRSCNEWCEEHGMVCKDALDDAHHQTANLSAWLNETGHEPTDCTILSHAARAWKETPKERCAERWKTQICACDKAEEAVEQRPPRPEQSYCGTHTTDGFVSSLNAILYPERPNFGKEEDCTKKDFHKWKGQEKADFVAPNYDGENYGEDENWEIFKYDSSVWDTSCVAYAHTGPLAERNPPLPRTCKAWCEEKGWVCSHAADDAHYQREGLWDFLNQSGYNPTRCSLIGDQPDYNLSIPSCEREFKTQICACKKELPTVNGCKAGNQIFSGVVMDCSNKIMYDFHKGGYYESFWPTLDPHADADEDEHWTKAPVQQEGGPWEAECVALVESDSNIPWTCETWCDDHGMTCVRGMDNAHFQNPELCAWMVNNSIPESRCATFSAGHGRQSQEDNGCKQSWKTQICACVPN